MLKRLAVGAVALALVAGVACNRQPPSRGPEPSALPKVPAEDELRTTLDSTLAATLGAASAPQGVAAVSVPGVATWEGSYSAPGVTEPITAEDLYPIRSITKSFTVTLVLQLASEDKVSMKDPISMYVEGVPNGDIATLSDLAANRSGIPDYSKNPDFIEKLTKDFERQWTTQELLDLAFAQKPSFAPGEGYEYSNTNTVLLGLVVESVTKESLKEAYEQRIWGPVDLLQTSYPDNADIPTPHLTPYEVDPGTGKKEESPTVNLSSLGASGGMVSSLRDMPLWVTALGDGSLIGKRLQEQRLASFGPTDGGPLYDEYGWGIGKIGDWIGHTGQGIGYQAATFYRPADGATVAVLLNSSQPDNVATEVFQALVEDLPPPS